MSAKRARGVTKAGSGVGGGAVLARIGWHWIPPSRLDHLPRVVVEVLDRHLNEHPPHDGMVWTTDDGAFLQRGSFGRIWRKAIAESVGTPCRIHDLRHTHAAWLTAAGEHPKAIQTRLGHSSIQVTIDRYGHLMDGLDLETAARLDAIAASVRGPGMAQDPPGLGR